MELRQKFFRFFPVSVLLLGLIVGFLYALPPLLLKKSAEEQGRFFVLPNLNHLSDDALYYFPRAREIYSGHFPSEVNFSEYKDIVWFILPPLPQALSAGFIALSGGDIPAAVIGLIFIFGIVNFLCFYAVGKVFLGSRLWATALAAAAVFTHAALRIPAGFYKKGVLLDIVANFIPVLRRPVGELSLMRIDDPLLTMPLYIISFLLLYRFAKQPDFKRALAAGAALGVLSYIYFFYWVMILAIAVMLFLYALFCSFRDGSCESLKSWGVFAAVFGILFIPHILNLFIFNSLPGAADYVMRKGIESGRGFRLSVYKDYLFYGGLGVAGFFLLRRAAPAVLFRFLAATLAAMFFLWNAQLLIGFNVEVDHFWKTFSPLLFIFGAVMMKAAYDRFITSERPRRAFTAALILLIFFTFAKKALNAAAFLSPSPEVVRSYSVPRSIAESWEWMDARLPSDATVITNSLVSATYISIFTDADPYLANAINTLAPTVLLERRFAEAHKIFGASADEMLARLPDPPFAVPEGLCPEPCAFDRERFRERFEFIHEFYPHELLYGTTFSPRLTFDAVGKPAAGRVSREARERLREHYDEYDPQWNHFPEHTYIYVSPWERLLSRGGVPEFPELATVFSNEDVRIYRVH